MTVTVTHVYDGYREAESVIRDLEGAGITKDQISVAGCRPETAATGEGSGGGGAPTGAAVGGLAGAGAGVLASLGIAIPGAGPLVPAGVLAAALAGAATGAAAGGLLGALVEYGISREDALVYAGLIGRGATLVSVRTEESKADQAEAVMQEHHPIDMTGRGNA